MSRENNRARVHRKSTEQERAAQRNNSGDKYLTSTDCCMCIRKPPEARKRMIREY